MADHVISNNDKLDLSELYEPSIRYQEKLRLVRALTTDKQALIDGKYFTQIPNESNATWDFRKKESIFVSGLAKAVEDFVDLIMKRQVKFSDNVPEYFVNWSMNVDRGSNSLYEFMAEVLKECLLAGQCFVKVNASAPPVAEINPLPEE